MLIKDFSSTVMEDKRSHQKHKIQAVGLKYQALNTEAHRAENKGFSCLERRNCCDVPVINYCMPLGTANLGKALANME